MLLHLLFGLLHCVIVRSPHVCNGSSWVQVLRALTSLEESTPQQVRLADDQLICMLVCSLAMLAALNPIQPPRRRTDTTQPTSTQVHCSAHQLAATHPVVPFCNTWLSTIKHWLLQILHHNGWEPWLKRSRQSCRCYVQCLLDCTDGSLTHWPHHWCQLCNACDGKHMMLMGNL